MRRRNMYYATGMPGWMRSSFGPGRGGMPQAAAQPCGPPQWWTPEQECEAQQQAHAGPMPYGQGPMPYWQGYPGGMPLQWQEPSREQYMQFLGEQLMAITDHLQMITDEIAAMEEEEQTQQ